MIIHWFRRDLRLNDNTALHHALRESLEVAPVYILSDWKKSHAWTGPGRQSFLCGCLDSLAKSLEAIGGRLIIRQGDQMEELRKFIRETKATHIFANRDPDPFGRKAEVAISKMAEAQNCRLMLYKDVAIHERDEVRTASDSPFRVFTPYSKAWRKLEQLGVLPKPRVLQTPKNIASLDLPTLRTWSIEKDQEVIEAGENAARNRMLSFINGPILAYQEKRNIPAEQGVSRLSQDLRWGLLSPRELYSKTEMAARDADATGRKNAEVFQNELIWREFYFQILWHYPEVLERDFNPKYAKVKWLGEDEKFTKWCRGETGFPIVDAAMRQLNRTGYMHNRLRMITAMFLTKDLHVHWKLGERYFMQKLVDGEIASNNGGWQWSAGTGADAAPYFRIQNPWTQTKRFDPEGKFIKLWLPELRDLDTRNLMNPPEGSRSIHKYYPSPIVDHARERDLTLTLFRTPS